uniref:Aminopeptidase n=1 Tax=Ditylenchus dipsaci TaxID=166011 RepID=A0A915DUL3_9BILA
MITDFPEISGQSDSKVQVGSDQSSWNIAVANVTVSNKLNKVWFILNANLLVGKEYFIKILTPVKSPTACMVFINHFTRQLMVLKNIWRQLNSSQIMQGKWCLVLMNLNLKLFGIEIKESQVFNFNGDNSWLMSTFAETPKMSSYLLALVVSDFAYKEASMVSTNNNTIRFRVWLRPEAIDMADWALDTGIKSLSFFEKKLDFAAGAMENWGLVTFKEAYLAYNQTSNNEFKKRLVSEIIAHEYAHQWFGDLVTMKWWNDLFLNEGFASFLTYPALGVSMNYTQKQLSDSLTENDEFWAFYSDAYSTSHPLHYTLSGPEDYNSIFNGISYGKGASVLRMIEQSLGTDIFYKGLQIYLKGITKQQTSSRDKMPYSVVDFGSGWITQANHPVVVAKRTMRLMAIFSREHGNPYMQPIYINVSLNDVLVINPNWIGFYRVSYDETLLNNIKSSLMTNVSSIPTTARVNILDSLFKLAEAGFIPYTVLLNFTTYLSNETKAEPWEFFFYNFWQLQRYYKDQPELKTFDNYALFLRNLRNSGKMQFGDSHINKQKWSHNDSRQEWIFNKYNKAHSYKRQLHSMFGPLSQESKSFDLKEKTPEDSDLEELSTQNSYLPCFALSLCSLVWLIHRKLAANAAKFQINCVKKCIVMVFN